MPDQTDQTEALVWLTPRQVPLARAVLAGVGCVPAVVGGPDASVGGAFGLAAATDLRAALAAAACPLALLMAPGEFGGRGGADAGVCREARRRGVRLVTLEPTPASLVDAMGESANEGAGFLYSWARLVPRSRWTGPVVEALEVLPGLGPVRGVAVRCMGNPGQGTLAARLFDAMDLCALVLGEPETIDAAFAGADHGKAIHAVPGETLRGPPPLHGEVTGNLRFADGRVACVFASDQAGGWGWDVTLVGERGRMRVEVGGWELLDGDGVRQDGTLGKRVRGARGKRPVAGQGVPVSEGEGHFLGAVVEQVRAAMGVGADVPPPGGGDANLGAALAMAQAALLSARTGEGESPATLRRMAGGV